MRAEELAMSDEAEVRAAEDRIETANAALDLDGLRACLAEGFHYVGGMGAGIDAGTWLANVAKRSAPEAKEREEATRQRATAAGRETVLLLTGLRVGEADQHEVELHGDVAIANKRYKIQDTDGSERCLRYVRVFRKTGGPWLLLSHRYIHAVD
jgi:hypothetical protein